MQSDASVNNLLITYFNRLKRLKCVDTIADQVLHQVKLIYAARSNQT